MERRFRYSVNYVNTAKQVERDTVYCTVKSLKRVHKRFIKRVCKRIANDDSIQYARIFIDGRVYDFIPQT